MNKNPSNQESTKYPELLPLWIGVFTDILGFTLFIPLLPTFIKNFGASNLEVGLLLSSNALFSGIFGPIFAHFSDKYGRKLLLLISQIGSLVGFIVFAFSKNMQMIFISRIIDGLFSGNFPIAKAIIGDVANPKDRSLQMTNIGMIFNLSNLIGPFLGGVLVIRYGIIGVGFVASLITLAAIFVTIFFLKETAPIKTNKNMQNINSNSERDKLNDNKNSSVMISPKTYKTAIILLIQWIFHSIAFSIIQSGFGLFAYLKLKIDE